MSAPSPITNYVVEVPKDDPRRTLPGFAPYHPSPVSPDDVRNALAEKDSDLASIQLAHYWLQTDWWIRKHNAEVEAAEKKRRDEEDMRKVEEHKRREIEEDQKQRRNRWRRKNGGRRRGRERKWFRRLVRRTPGRGKPRKSQVPQRRKGQG